MPLLALLIGTSPADANPHAWTVGLAPSYAYMVTDSNAQPKGGGVSAVVLYGLTSALALRLSGGWTGHIAEPTTGDSSLHQVTHAMAGIRYSFDLVAVDPAIEGGIGILHQRNGQSSSSDLGLQVGMGFDYWILRWISLGAFFHYYAFLSNPTRYPVYFDAGPRVELRWPR